VREYIPYKKKNSGKETHAHRTFVGIVPSPPPDRIGRLYLLQRKERIREV
jgi:hypothetical protein